MKPNPTHTPEAKAEAAPKKRSITKIILLVLWLVVVIGWFYFIATWQIH